MLEALITFASLYYEHATLFAADCWLAWVNDPKPYRFCYAGLFGTYLAVWLGADHARVGAIGAALYLALYWM